MKHDATDVTHDIMTAYSVVSDNINLSSSLSGKVLLNIVTLNKSNVIYISSPFVISSMRNNKQSM